MDDDLVEAWEADDLAGREGPPWPDLPDYSLDPRRRELLDRAVTAGSADVAWDDRLAAYDAADEWDEANR